MILVDTSGVLAALDRSQRRHRDCAQVITTAEPPFVLSPFVLAELDYLLMRHLGRSAQSAFLDDVARGAWQLEAFDETDIARASEIMARYPDHDIGLADASIVVLAERLDVAQVLTLDHRHFSVLRWGVRRQFRLLPAD